MKFGTSGLRGLSVDLKGHASALYATAFGKYLLGTGRAKAVLEALDPGKKIDPYKLLFPIPANEVQLGAPLLTQNDGYTN